MLLAFLTFNLIFTNGRHSAKLHFLPPKSFCEQTRKGRGKCNHSSATIDTCQLPFRDSKRRCVSWEKGGSLVVFGKETIFGRSLKLRDIEREDCSWQHHGVHFGDCRQTNRQMSREWKRRPCRPKEKSGMVVTSELPSILPKVSHIIKHSPSW